MAFVELARFEQRSVQVLHEDGRWYDGWLEAYDDDGMWRGFVRYITAPGAACLTWVPEQRIRGTVVPASAGT